MAGERHHHRVAGPLGMDGDARVFHQEVADEVVE